MLARGIRIAHVVTSGAHAGAWSVLARGTRIARVAALDAHAGAWNVLARGIRIAHVGAPGAHAGAWRCSHGALGSRGRPRGASGGGVS